MGFFDFLKKEELAEIAQLKQQLEQYQPITDVYAHAQAEKERLAKELSTVQTNIFQQRQGLEKLKNDYRMAYETFTRLRREVDVYEEKVDMAAYGVYVPMFSFEHSEQYRTRLEMVTRAQKELISNGRAAVCSITWTIDGSEAKGKANTQRYIKLTLRAFNGECDALIAKVKWNNANQVKERIYKSFDAINKLGETQKVHITNEYLKFKIEELHLEHEYQLKKQQEKEEQRAAQELMREEEKARREFEQAQREAEKEELNYERVLEKTKKELKQASGAKVDELKEKIAKLEHELNLAHQRKERAISMAQQTKRGHVYIISNIGSFGEEVYKIGMTRRLEPEDRIRELGDASVPFHFDIHAMIFSEDAPALENELHRAFAHRRLNLVNQRKEFFKVTLNDIEQEVNRMGLTIALLQVPEAVEYRETLGQQKDTQLTGMKEPEPTKFLFPDSLFTQSE